MKCLNYLCLASFIFRYFSVCVYYTYLLILVFSTQFSLYVLSLWLLNGCKFIPHSLAYWASQEALVVKNLPASARDARDMSSSPGSRRSPGGGHGNPLQYWCLENPMNRGAWRATGRGVTKSQTQLQWFSTHTLLIIPGYNSWDFPLFIIYSF